MKILKHQQGFTIVELMVIVGIIATLASIAIPAYQGYVVRTKVVEGLSLASSAKAAVSENAVNALPFDSSWTPPFPTEIVSTDPTGTSHSVADSGVSINNTNGEITITYTNKIALGSPTLLLIPVDGANALAPGQIVMGGLIYWQCHSATAPLDDVLRGRLGTINSELVPSHCRA